MTDCLGALRFKLEDVVVPSSFIGFFIDQDLAGLHKLTFEFFDIVLHVASLLLQTDNRFHSAAPPEIRAKMRKADDIKNIALFLASHGPLGITGESLDVSAWDKIYQARETARTLFQ